METTTNNRFLMLAGRLAFLLMFMTLLALGAKYYWILELFTHFAWQYALVGAVLSMLFLAAGRIVMVMLLLPMVLWNGYQAYPYWQAPKAVMEERAANAKGEVTDTLKIVQYNVQRSNTHKDEVVKWVLQQKDADIVVLFEITDEWNDQIRTLRQSFRYNIMGSVRGGRNILLLSRLPLERSKVEYYGFNGGRGVAMRTTTARKFIPVDMYAIHPSPPILASIAGERNKVLAAVADRLVKSDATHKILIGDFNTTPYSPYFKQVLATTGMKDSNIGLGQKGTWPAYVPSFLAIAIDNLLITDNIKVISKEISDRNGSDHYPVITTLELKQ